MSTHGVDDDRSGIRAAQCNPLIQGGEHNPLTPRSRSSSLRRASPSLVVESRVAIDLIGEAAPSPRCADAGPTAAGAAASRATPASARYHDALALVLLVLPSTPGRCPDILAVKTTTLACRTRKSTALRWQLTPSFFLSPIVHERRRLRPTAHSGRFLRARQPSSRSSASHCSPTMPAARWPTESALSSPPLHPKLQIFWIKISR